MLKTLKLHNFKTFLNTEIRFSRRHLIVGKNNSGKTNLASAIKFLSGTSMLDLVAVANFVPGVIGELCNWRLDSKEIEIGCTCDLEFEGKPCEFEYSLRLSLESPAPTTPTGAYDLRVLLERLSVTTEGLDRVRLLENDGKKAVLLDEEQTARRQNIPPKKMEVYVPQNATMLSKLFESRANKRAILFKNFLGGWAYYSFIPNAMRGGYSTSSQLPAPLAVHGDNLANAVFHLKNMDERRYRRVIENTQIVEPALEAINFFVAPNQEPYPFVVLKDCPSASWTGLSDGTLRVLALAYLVEQAAAVTAPDAPTGFLAVIEEPENGIFPGQLRKVFDLFEEWAPQAQFIFTSHSPYFIDMFDNKRDSVTILEKAADRSLCRAAPAPEPAGIEDRLTLSDQYASELLK